MHVHVMPEAGLKSGHVEFPPAGFGNSTAGECEATPKKTPLSKAKHVMIPTKLIRSSFLLPALSTKKILTMEPKALRPEVMRDSAKAVLLEAKPAN